MLSGAMFQGGGRGLPSRHLLWNRMVYLRGKASCTRPLKSTPYPLCSEGVQIY